VAAPTPGHTSGDHLTEAMSDFFDELERLDTGY
jgi:hypothetical protein